MKQFLKQHWQVGAILLIGIIAIGGYIFPRLPFGARTAVVTLGQLSVTSGYTIVGGSNGKAVATSSLYIASNGDVGIGTTSPAYKLDVYGNTRIDGDLTISGSIDGYLSLATYFASTTPEHITGLPNLDTVGTVTTGTWTSDVIGTSYGGTGTSTWSNGYVVFYDGSTLSQDVGYLFWDATNNRLGIGTTSPTYTLEVAGDIFASGDIFTSSSSLWLGDTALSNNNGTLQFGGEDVGGSGNTLIHMDYTGVSYINSAAENTLCSATIPGGSLGTGNAIKGKIFIQTIDSAGVYSNSYRLKYGGATIATYNASEDSSVVDGTGEISFILASTGATNSQWGLFDINARNFGYGTGITTFRAGAEGTASQDSTGDLTLSFTSQMVNSNSDVVMRGCVIELLQ